MIEKLNCRKDEPIIPLPSRCFASMNTGANFQMLFQARQTAPGQLTQGSSSLIVSFIALLKMAMFTHVKIYSKKEAY